jgi:hypothetical protein
VSVKRERSQEHNSAFTINKKRKKEKREKQNTPGFQ